MPQFVKILFFVSVCFSRTNVFAQSGRLDNRYITTGYNAGVLMTLKPDFSFTYKYRGPISSDTAAGQYSFKGDTILLRYDYNNFDSIFASYRANNKIVPIEIQLAAGRANLRPFKLFRKGKRLYYIDEVTGEIKTYTVKDKNQKLFMIPYK
jgi:hypothetical protein